MCSDSRDKLQAWHLPLPHCCEQMISSPQRQKSSYCHITTVRPTREESVHLRGFLSLVLGVQQLGAQRCDTLHFKSLCFVKERQEKMGSCYQTTGDRHDWKKVESLSTKQRQGCPQGLGAWLPPTIYPELCCN